MALAIVGETGSVGLRYGWAIAILRGCSFGLFTAWVSLPFAALIYGHSALASVVRTRAFASLVVPPVPVIIGAALLLVAGVQGPRREGYNHRVVKTRLRALAGVIVMSLWTMPLTAADASEAPMPVAQQNALVQKYCAVCHTDAVPNGRLTLQSFDMAHADPGIAAMLASKLRGNALGASGQALPDRATQKAFLDAMEEAGAGSDSWHITQQPAQLTASIVRTQASPAGGDPNLYRLSITCHSDTREGEMELTWAPGVPQSGQVMSATVDGAAPAFTRRIEGKEAMGNGQPGASDPGGVVLPRMPLPERTLTISNVFGSESAEFSLGGLNGADRAQLAACFGASAR